MADLAQPANAWFFDKFDGTAGPLAGHAPVVNTIAPECVWPAGQTDQYSTTWGTLNFIADKPALTGSGAFRSSAAATGPINAGVTYAVALYPGLGTPTPVGLHKGPFKATIVWQTSGPAIDNTFPRRFELSVGPDGTSDLISFSFGPSLSATALQLNYPLGGGTTTVTAAGPQATLDTEYVVTLEAGDGKLILKAFGGQIEVATSLTNSQLWVGPWVIQADKYSQINQFILEPPSVSEFWTDFINTNEVL